MLERFSEEEILQKVGQISIRFPLLKCDKCAIAIMEWLSKNEIECKILRLKTKQRNEAFITSDRPNCGAGEGKSLKVSKNQII